MKTAIAYSRISGAHTQNELSIKEQIFQIRRYCNEEQITILHEFEEKHSAFRGSIKYNPKVGRKIFNEVLDYISKNKVDYLLVFKLDRLSRNGNDFITLENLCEKRGVQVVAITENYGLTGPMGNFSIRNSRNLAQLYSEELSFKSKLGMRRAMMEGKHSGSVIPIGYIKIAKNKAIIDPERSNFIKRTFDLYARGEYSYLSLSEKLAKEGFTKQDGTPINNKVIERILGQEIYTGSKTMRWNLKPYELPFFGAKKAGIFEEKYKLDIEPLISEEVFLKVKNIKADRNKYLNLKNKDNKRRRNQKYFLFQGAFKCSCGRSITGYHIEAKNLTYYGCCRGISANFPEKCHELPIQEKYLLSQVVKQIKKYRISPETMRKIKEGMNTQKDTQSVQDNILLKEINVGIVEMKKKQMNLTEKYMDGKIGDENYSLLENKYKEDIFELEMKRDATINYFSNQSDLRKNKIFLMWVSSQIEAIIEHMKVRVKPKTLTKLKYINSNQILTIKKLLPIAENSPLNFCKNVLIHLWLRRYESNVRPQGYEPCELPLLYSAI